MKLICTECGKEFKEVNVFDKLTWQAEDGELLKKHEHAVFERVK